MAEDRTFTLIGNFQDNITPKLRSINEQINALNGTIAKFKTNGRDLSKEFGSIATSLSAVSAAARENRTALTRNKSDLEGYLSTLKKIGAEQERILRYSPPRIGGGGGSRGGGPGGTLPGGGGGYGSGGSGLFRDSANVFGLTVGNTISNLLTNSIVAGFRVGVGLMEKPFQAAANAFGERIQDETTDIQAAGGLFAVSQRKGLGLFPDFTSAMREQQRINYKLAQSAAALPGATEEYVRQGKLLTDTMIGVLAKNKTGTIKFSQSIGGDGTAAGALETIVQKFTEKAVLLGQGTQSRSIYGIPQLTERLINAENVTPNMFSRYAAFINNPLVANAFKEMTPQLAKTAAGSAERLKLAYELLDKSLPNEVIQAYKSSVAGTFENLRSLLFDPEVGLFGLGRKFKKIAPQVDQFGRYINEQGQVVDQMSKAAKDNLGVFDLLKDIIVGFGNPFAELIPVLMQLFDPLKKVTDDLIGLRTIAQDFYRNFHSYSAYFTQLGKDMGSYNISSTSGARGALAAINNLLRALKVVDISQFESTGKELKDRNANLPQIASKLLKQLFDSDFMRQIGEMIGRIIGDTLSMVAQILTGATDFATMGGFAGGLKSGFYAAKGPEAIQLIIKDLFGLLFEAIKAIIAAAPIETISLGLGALILPALGAVVSAFAVDLAKAGLSAAKGKILSSVAQQAAGSIAGEVAGGAATSATSRYLRLSENRMAGTILRPAVGAGIEAAGASAAGAAGAGAAGAGGGALAVAAAPIALAAGVILTAAYGFKVFSEMANGTAAKNTEAAYRQLQAADLQKQAANLSRGGVKTTQALSFGSVASLQQRLSAMGLLKTEKGANLLEKYGMRDVFSSRLQSQTEALNKEKTKIGVLGLGAEETARRLAPFNAAINQTKVSLQRSQTDLEKAFKDLGPKVQDALIANLSNFHITVGGQLTDSQGKGFPATLDAGNGGGGGGKPSGSPPPKENKPWWKVWSDGSDNPHYSSSLGGALAYETAHKPSGSDLVIANSSETVIPAAGGFGMSDLLGTMTTGFYNLTQNISSIQNNLTRSIDGKEQKSEKKFNTLTEKLTEMSQQISKLSTTQGGSMLGIGGGGNIVSVGQQLLAMGLQVGENPYFQYGAGYLPGGGGRVGQHAKGSYHYLGRALDVSGSVGQLNQVYAMLKGTNPSELLWQVPGHYDHLHVAYALGKGNPAFFGSQSQAMAWEKQMMPPTAKVQSFTSNTSEGFGNNGTITVNAPITINQLPGQSPKELAALVAMEISNAVADVRNASYYV
jgi:hypothetical protein